MNRRKALTQLFDGAGTSRPRWEARGDSRKELTRGETVAKLQREKEKRKRAQKRNDASSRIQAAWKAWLSRRDAKKVLRDQWMTEVGMKVDRASLKWVHVSWIVVFLDARENGDVCAFSNVCRVLVADFMADGGLRLVAMLNGETAREREVSWMHRLSVLLEKCMHVLEQRAQEWMPLLLMQTRGDIEWPTEFAAIAECILTFLNPSAWNVEIGNEVGLLVGQKLIKRGILLQLGGIVRRCFPDNAVTSVTGTVLEQIMDTVMQLDASQTDVKSAKTAFELFASFPSQSGMLMSCRHNMLMHALSFLFELCDSTAAATRAPPSPIRSSSGRLELTSPGFHRICLSFFWNAMDLGCSGADSLFGMPRSDNSGHFRLAAAMVRFMVFVIGQDLQWEDEDEEDMMDEGASSSESTDSASFDVSSRLMACMQLFQQSNGQSILLSLAEALFSAGQTEDGSALMHYCELLYFVLRVLSQSATRYSMLLRLAWSGRLVERLWHDCIQCNWNVPNSSAPDKEHLECLVAPLLVLCEIYSAFLSVAGEREVCQQQIPLRLSEVYDTTFTGDGLITVLKKCIWNMVWVRMPFNASDDASGIRAAMMTDFSRTCGRLLMQLSENSARWNLVSRDRFYIQSAQLTQFVEEASSVAIREAEEEAIDQALKRTSVILRHVPCLIPFQYRAQIFQAQLEFHRAQSPVSSGVFALPRVHARVRRDSIFEDSFDQLRHLNRLSFQGRIRVEFIDEHGMVEAGVDGGGLFKDFIEELVNEAFDPEKGYFAVTDEQELYPNPSACMTSDHLSRMTFLGRMLGKAVYDGILVELPLANFFLKKFQGLTCDLHDLPSLDPEVYTNLMQLRNLVDLESLELRFTITDNAHGGNDEVELKPNGKQIPVTKINVVEYMSRFADYRLNKEPKRTTDKFIHGFYDVIQREWVQMFKASELRMLISGSTHELDLVDMRDHVQYSGGYHAAHPVIVGFWEVLGDLSVEEHRHFLKFVTGCSRAPLLGFGRLRPRMCIQMAGRQAEDHEMQVAERLPTSATCMNLLKLPPYSTKELMKEKLLYAISSATGFYLS